jgi:hypothetical protein
MKWEFVWKTKAHRQHSCERKVRYGHKTTASLAALKMQEKVYAKFDVYECRYCKGWHIGHSYFQDSGVGSRPIGLVA